MCVQQKLHDGWFEGETGKHENVKILKVEYGFSLLNIVDVEVIKAKVNMKNYDKRKNSKNKKCENKNDQCTVIM